MELVVKNGFLSIGDLKLKCSIGRNGLTSNKSEGDGCTPIGTFKINKILYRDDKININNFMIESKIIKPSDGWCDDIRSDQYNSGVKLPFEYSAENLYRSDDLYDIICVIDYNLNPIVKNKGSAIFLHVAKGNFLPTEGCIAIEKNSLLEIAIKLNKNSSIKIEY